MQNTLEGVRIDTERKEASLSLVALNVCRLRFLFDNPSIHNPFCLDLASSFKHRFDIHCLISHLVTIPKKYPFFSRINALDPLITWLSNRGVRR